MLPILKDLLKDENDSVKIHAVNSSVTVAKLLQNPEIVQHEIIPAFREAIDNKLSWRLRFALAESGA